MKQTIKKTSILLGIIVLSNLLFGAGMDQMNTTLETLVQGFSDFSKAIITLAFLWVGYKVLFAGSALRDLAPIIIGALIIGTAGLLAEYFNTSNSSNSSYSTSITPISYQNYA